VKWPFNCQPYKRTTADDSDWVTDNDLVMSDDGESDNNKLFYCIVLTASTAAFIILPKSSSRPRI
jgi:hypothetical protein